MAVVINLNSSLPDDEKLSKCLASAGVDSRDIHFRNSGKIYTELNWQWNTLNGYVEPLAYLLATTVSDIQNAIRCCQSSNIRIVPRSGGHSFLKNSYGDSNSLVVDLGRLNEISLHPNEMQCEIGAGARMGRIIATLSEKGNFLLPTGVCSSVGIAGLTLGGGYGHSTRLFGLTLDNVIEMEMVDATGQLLVVNGEVNENLFWALRGAGGGSYGIVTKFKFKMYTAPETVLYGIYYYSFEDFGIFFNALQDIINDLPNNINSLINIEKNYILMFLYALNYQNSEAMPESIDNFDKFLNSFPVPIKNLTRLLSYSDFILKDSQMYASTLLTHPSQLANITRHNQVGWKKFKSFYVDKILKNDSISDLKGLIDGYVDQGSVQAGVLIELTGGAINNVSRSETSFIHRGNNLYVVQLYLYLKENEQPNEKAESAMKRFYEESKTVFHHTESYQNYLDQDIPDYLQRYYGDNLKKLIQIKNLVDPNNVFHHPQSIPIKFN